MTSICNYSHPELQIHDGLVRQQTGSLFPYNPEFYERATGLYGPGAIYCWHLLLASLLINWGFHPRDGDGYKRPPISSDFLAVIAFPVFAGTDALICAINLLGTEYRALAIFCIRNPETELKYFAEFNNTQLDLREIPPDILDLGQRVIDITGSITVCYTFSAVFFLLILLVFLDLTNKIRWQPKLWVTLLSYVAYGYVCLCLIIIHLGLGDVTISFYIFLYEGILPFEWSLMLGMTFLAAVGLIGYTFLLVKAIIELDTKGTCAALGSLIAMLLYACLPALCILAIYKQNIRLVPDLAVSVTERDQLATLIVGIATLMFTCYDVLRRLIRDDTRRQGDESEMQTLTTNV